MSLVCYGSSDSEEEAEQEIIPETEEQSIFKSGEENTPKFDSEKRTVVNFDSIPKPNKGRETVKITIPSLNQFKDEDIKIESKAKPTFKGGSGLLGMLPPPKYSGSTTQRSLTPHVLTKQKNAVKKVPDFKSVPTKLSSKDINSASKVKHSSDNISTNNDEEEDSSPVDFFSLESVHKKIENGALDTQLPSKSSLFKSLPQPNECADKTMIPVYQEEVTSTSEPIPSNSSVQSENYSVDNGWNENYPSTYSSDQASWNENCEITQNSDQTDDETQFLNDERFKKMVGRKNEGIKIIDVSADDQLIGKEQWLMKSLTEEKVHRPLKRRGEMPTQQQKRKHQITYLAFQAKERELDLKNQWSLNSKTRRETQAKYGF